MGRANHQAGKRLFLISFLFLGIFVLLVSPVSALENVMDNDCNIKDEVFDRDWKKYSDLENTPLTFKEHPLTARSRETQQYYFTQSEIVDAELQIFFLKRDMEIDRLMRLELKEYKKELVDGHRKNLLKSFCRLSFLTVHTTYEAYHTGKSLVGTPKAPGGTYGNLFTTPSLVSAIGSALKITNTYKAMAPPKSSSLANNTQGIANVVDDATLNIALETVESLADPKKIALEVVTQIMKAAPVPTSANEWKLTEDDFNILKTEHIKNKELDKTITESYKANLERNNKVKELELRIKELKIELAKREAKEKSRVKDSLVDNCKEREKEAEDEKCDCEHLCLCDNENDCMTAGGYWYNGQCNECPEGDTSEKVSGFWDIGRVGGEPICHVNLLMDPNQHVEGCYRVMTLSMARCIPYVGAWVGQGSSIIFKDSNGRVTFEVKRVKKGYWEGSTVATKGIPSFRIYLKRP